MEKKSIKKLQLKKEIVAKLNKNEMEQVVGGHMITMTASCGANCTSVNIACHALPIDNQPSNWLCGSFAEGPTCGGTICGSDQSCQAGCVTGGEYSFDICTGQEGPTGGWVCSVCVC